MKTKLFLLAAACPLLFGAADAMAAKVSIYAGYTNVNIQVIDLKADDIESSYTKENVGGFLYYVTEFGNQSSSLDARVDDYGSKVLSVQHGSLSARAVSHDSLTEGGKLTFDLQDDGALQAGEYLHAWQSGLLNINVAANTMLIVTGQYTYRQSIDPALGYTVQMDVTAGFNPSSNAWHMEPTGSFTRDFTIGYINNSTSAHDTHLSFDQHFYLAGPAVQSIPAVPEPAEGALLAVGLGLVAFTARRRANKPA